MLERVINIGLGLIGVSFLAFLCGLFAAIFYRTLQWVISL